MNTTARLARTVRVLRTASRIFVGYRLRSWRTRSLPAEEAEQRMSDYHRKSAERIYETATQLQGLLIKVGQMMGARADIFPDEYVEVLSRLHDTVPPRPYTVIRNVIEKELGKPIGDVFSGLNPVPIASASLAQVHRGRLLDGREVAVKVQYPGIEDIVQVDLKNVRILAGIANRVMRGFDFTDLVDEMSANVPHELNFIHEGQNAETTAANFAGQGDILVPKIYWEHCTRRVLVMEFMEGIKITDFEAMAAAGIDRQAVAKLLVESFAKQIFTHGFFHADPHPGNLFVQPGPKLVIVDFGLAKQLQPEFLRGFVHLMSAMFAQDSAALAKAFRELGFKTKREDDGVFEALGEAMVSRLARSAEFNSDKEMMAEFQQRMMRIFRENPVVRVPGEFLYIGRVMGLLGGLGKQLGSQVNLLEVLGAQLPPPAPAPAG